MNYDPTERIMEIFGIPGFWNLVWIIPLCIGIGWFISAYWPFGKGFEGPPYYAGFDANDGHEHGGSCEDAHGDDYTGRHRFDGAESPVDVDMQKAAIISLANIDSPFAASLAMEINRDIVNYDTPHPDNMCDPTCWRKPDGHRWGDEH